MGWGESRHPAIAAEVVTAADGEPMIRVTEQATDRPVKCPTCDRTLAWFATRPYSIRCRHCKVDVTR